ncbi:unnamed protein product [Closterium sp. Naga37s-1]|nr:unnamed protein product [Closterium sp. Naga37s-1]
MSLPTFKDVAGGKVSPLFVAVVVATSVVALHWVAIRWSSASYGASDGASGGAGNGASWSGSWWFGKRVESGECGVRCGTGKLSKNRRKKRKDRRADGGEDEVHVAGEEDSQGSDDEDEWEEDEGAEGEGDEKPQSAFRRVLADNSRAPFQHLKRNEAPCEDSGGISFSGAENEDEDESEDSGDVHPYGDDIRHLIQNPPPPNHMLPPGTTPPPPVNDPGVVISSALPSQAKASSSSSPSSSSPSSAFHWVSTKQQLASLAALLETQDEFAVDTEQHSHRSFLGFTALIQISTRAGEDFVIDAIALHDHIGDALCSISTRAGEDFVIDAIALHDHIGDALCSISTRDGRDFIIDAIALHDHIGDALRPVFANPAITKLFHGADSDVLWLQRDFHIYTVNLFDTARACSVLNKPYRSLAFLLEHYCHVSTDKRLQLADWRRRPLPPAMLQYARTDSHYLPYIAGRLRWELVQADAGGEGGDGASANGKGEAAGGGGGAAAAAAGVAAGAGGGGRRGSRAGHSSGSKYEEAVRRSNALCLQLYEKPGERSAGAADRGAVGEAVRERRERGEVIGGSAEAAAAAAAALFRQLLGVCGYVGGAALSGGPSGDSAGSGAAASAAPDAAATSAGQKTSDRSQVLREVRAVLDAVTRWRDTVAREEDESLRFLLADVAVVAVALLRPATCQELIGCVGKAMAAAAALTPPSLREEAGVPRPIQGEGNGGESGTLESTEGVTSSAVAEQQAIPSQPASPSPSPPLVRRSPELVALITATCLDVRGGEVILSNTGTSDGREEDRVAAAAVQARFAEISFLLAPVVIQQRAPAAVQEAWLEEAVALTAAAAGLPEDDENEFYIQSKSNRCVSCGESTHYLRYRLVPSCYRHAFPEHLKSHRSHDIVLLCVDCHDVAHRAAEIFKREVARRFGVPLLLSPLDRRFGGGSDEGGGEEGGEGAGEGGSVSGDGAGREKGEGGEEEGGGQMEGAGSGSGERKGGRDARVKAAFLLNDAAQSAVAVLRHGASLPESRLCELLLPVWKVLKRAAGSPVKIEELEMVVQAGKGTRVRAGKRKGLPVVGQREVLQKALASLGGGGGGEGGEREGDGVKEDVQAEGAGDLNEVKGVDAGASEGVSEKVSEGVSDQSGKTEEEVTLGLAAPDLTALNLSATPTIEPVPLRGHWEHGTKVVALLLEGGGEAGIREFTQQWREVFVAALQPRFLPPGWDVQHLGRRQFGEFSVYNPQRRRYVKDGGDEGGKVKEGGEGGVEGRLEGGEGEEEGL